MSSSPQPSAPNGHAGYADAYAQRAALMAAMDAAGVSLGSEPLIADGLVHRYVGPGDHRDRKNCWYVAHEHVGKYATFLAADFGSWRLLITEHWNSGSSVKLSKEDRSQLEAERAAAQVKAEAAKKERQAEAAIEAQQIWDSAKPITAASEHLYLVRKQIQPHGVRLMPNGKLVVPLHDVDTGEIVSLESISATGEKCFLPGGRKAGTYYPIPMANAATDKPLMAIIIAEGLATSCTTFEGSDGLAGCCTAFDAGNLPKVARAIRTKYSHVIIVLAADLGDIGQSKAREAAEAVGGCVATPKFPPGVVGKDWNDLAIGAGQQAVREQLLAVIGTASKSVTDGQPTTQREVDPPGKYSDLTLANRLITEHRKVLLHVELEKSWYIYNDPEYRWARDDKLHIFTLAKRLVVSAAQELYSEVFSAVLKETSEEDAHQQARQAANSISTAAKVAAIVNLARSDPRVAVTSDIFDRDPWLLNTPGVAVNLKDGTTRTAQREDFFTKITTVTPRRMPTPNFDKFMQEIMGGRIPPEVCECAACKRSTGEPKEVRQRLHDEEVEELVKYQYRLYGYVLSGDTREHILAIQIGDGGNGKGVINELVSRDLMGMSPVGYAAEIPIDALLVQKYTQHPCDLMLLRGARLALSAESDEGGALNEGRIKKLTGGNPVTARGMRENPITFPSTHKIIMSTNDEPRVSGADQAAFRRRLQMTLFPQTFADEANEAEHVLKADLDLLDKLRPEAPGIMQLLIDGGLERLRLGGTKPPLTVRLKSNEFLDQQNVIKRCLDETCEKGEFFQTTTETLWAIVLQWCERNHETPGPRPKFNGRLAKLGIKIVRTSAARGICRGIQPISSSTEE